MLKENLIMLRNIHGFSQEKIAKKIGITRQAYAKWESGQTLPDIEKCRKIAEVYGVSIDSLVTTEKQTSDVAAAPVPNGKKIWGSVVINDRGQMVIPKAARDRFGMVNGVRLIVLSDEEGISLVKADEFEAKMKRIIEYSRMKK